MDLMLGVTSVLFNVGDKVVYPMHGAGIIESIEEREILGETKKYFVMTIPVGNMKVMIPIEKVGELGLREVADEQALIRVETILRQEESPMSSNWNQRYRMNLDKLRSGEITEIADVVRNLMIREREKGLSTGERKMLDNAKQMLVSELALAKNMEAQEAYAWLEEAVAHHHEPH